jgi:undecaprenyl diphosphate synthase
MNFGIIADGNRRWARENGVATREGHQKGFWAIKDQLFPVLYEGGEFKALTIYAFSTENWKRSVIEVRYLMKLYADMLDKWLPELLEKGVKVVHAGRKTRIPGFLKKKIKEAEKASKTGRKFTIYLCLDYGGRDEILRAVRKGSIARNLEVPDLDLVMRTGGENRLSNFCIWQAAYAEFFFVKKFLPEIKKKDVTKVIADFKAKNRRKGGN